jgi:tetratricopeptide (TPR) repeat protein
MAPSAPQPRAAWPVIDRAMPSAPPSAAAPSSGQPPAAAASPPLDISDFPPKLAALMKEFKPYFQSKQWDEALAGLDEKQKTEGASIEITHVRIALLRGAGRLDEASAQTGILVDQAWSDEDTLNATAWDIAAVEIPGTLDQALKAALRASELTQNKDPSILDTVAYVYHARKEIAQAIEWQKKAVANDATGDAELRARLQQYEAEQ